MRDFLIIGTGAQGRLIAEIVDKVKHYQIVSAENHTDISDDIKEGIVAIGDNHTRAEVVRYVLDMIPDFQFKWVYHPSVVIGENVTIGRGTMIMAGAIINNGAQIGEHCIINSGVIVEHDNKIGNFVNLQPGVVTGGYVEIGDHSSIGLGAMIRDRVKIGSRAVIGMGSVVLEDMPENRMSYGNPARVRTNEYM